MIFRNWEGGCTKDGFCPGQASEHGLDNLGYRDFLEMYVFSLKRKLRKLNEEMDK